MPTPRGLDCKAYYNAGTYNTPTWTLVAKAQDVDLPLSSKTAELMDRSSAWERTVQTGRIAKATIKYNKAFGADTVFAIFMGSYLNGTVIDALIIDGAVTAQGAHGVRFPAIVTDVKIGQPLNGVQEHTFELAAADDSHEPVEFTAP